MPVSKCHLYIRDLAVSSNPPPAPHKATFLHDDWHIPVDTNHQSCVWACFSWFPKSQCVTVLPACCSSLSNFGISWAVSVSSARSVGCCGLQPQHLLQLPSVVSLPGEGSCSVPASPGAEPHFCRHGRIPICPKEPGQNCSFVAVPPLQLGLCSSGFVRKLKSFTCPYHVLVLF